MFVISLLYFALSRGRLERISFMALKATIYKANLQVADLDRGYYGDFDLTIARHPSETDERLLIRLLAFALNVPKNNDQGALEFAKDMWEPDEPGLWQKDLTGQLQQWIEIGQPDEKRLMKASSRSRSVSVYSFSSSTPIWWNGIATKLTRARNLTVIQVPPGPSQSLAALAQRAMRLQVTVQDGSIYMGDDQRSIEVSLHRLLDAKE